MSGTQIPFFNCYEMLVCSGSSLAQRQSQSCPGCVLRVISLFEGGQSAVDQVLTCSVLPQSWISGAFYCTSASFIYSSTVWTLCLNAEPFHLLGPPSTLTQDIWSSATSHLLLRTFSQFSQLAQCGWTTSEESCFFANLFHFRMTESHVL